MNRIRFRTADHPEANGRNPLPGEAEWKFDFALEDGTKLTIMLGKSCHDAFRRMLDQEEIDDLADSHPTGN